MIETGLKDGFKFRLQLKYPHNCKTSQEKLSDMIAGIMQDRVSYAKSRQKLDATFTGIVNRASDIEDRFISSKLETKKQAIQAQALRDYFLNKLSFKKNDK